MTTKLVFRLLPDPATVTMELIESGRLAIVLRDSGKADLHPAFKTRVAILDQGARFLRRLTVQARWLIKAKERSVLVGPDGRPLR